MSATSKGNAFELEVKKILENKGWTVFRQHRKPMFMNGKMITVGCDIFGSDMVAKKTNEKTHFIQVTTRPNKTAKMKILLQYPWNYNHDVVQIWLRSDGKREFEIFQAPDFESVGIQKAI